MAASLTVEEFFDPVTGTFSYLLADEAAGAAAVIDPVMGFDLPTGQCDLAPVRPIRDRIAEKGLRLDWILETHIHADHVSAAPWLKAECGGEIAIGAGVEAVQAHFSAVYTVETDVRVFDRVLAPGDTVAVGRFDGVVIAAPGHTPADCAFAFEGSIFVGDTLFAPDLGSARTDFPGGDARALYRSIQTLLAYPPDTRLYLCHDYPKGRAPQCMHSVAQHRAENIHVRDGVSEDAFVAMREARNAQLGPPRLIVPSIQLNIRAGYLPAPTAGGQRYIKWPVIAPR